MPLGEEDEQLLIKLPIPKQNKQKNHAELHTLDSHLKAMKLVSFSIFL